MTITPVIERQLRQIIRDELENFFTGKGIKKTGLLTIADVADKLQVKVKTIYNWVNEKRIEYVKLPQGVRFREEYIEKWIAKRTIKPKV
jgi:excisionase family DNA binding protein